MKSFGDDNTIFANMDVLNPNTNTYQPDELPERESELDQLHSALRPATMGSTPLNVFVYGPTGQGKTAGIKLKTRQLQNYANENDLKLSVVHVGCKGLDKSYHVLTHIVKELREVRYGPGEELPSGYQRKELLGMVLDELEAIGGTVILVLDEIDAIGTDDYALYELPRAEPSDVRLSIIGITNDLQFRDNLAADVRSSLGEDEIEFSPYDATQIKAILYRRAAGALRDTTLTDDDATTPDALETDVLTDDVIPLCSAFAAQETGDAREAIKLLFRACRLADDSGDNLVTEDHVRRARDQLERRAIESGIRSLPTQRQLALLTVTRAELHRNTPAETNDLYETYTTYCQTADIDRLSNRRFRDRLNDLADSNILDKSTRGRGQGLGISNRYKLAVDTGTVLDNMPGDEDRLGDITATLRRL